MMSCKALPETVTGITVDDQCGSSQQTCHFAAQAVMSGTQETVYVETDDWDDAHTEDALLEDTAIWRSLCRVWPRLS